MEQTVWVKAQAIFHEVVDLPMERQQAVLEILCEGDDALLSRVAEMLDEDRQQEGLLDAGLAPLADSLLDHENEGQQQVRIERIGAYRLLRELGQGGMGIVYLAERTDIGGFAAIKLLRDAWVSPARRRRFALEQRTLARLSHPAIAQIYDADTLADGTPWFVMEYVDGVPLTTYWESRRDSAEGCLRLFRAVCEAVLYAHRRAVIHRDLKPSNILVTGEGAIKLLDFGIAKHLDENEPATDLTLVGMRPMTPAHAAPEQHRGEPVGVFTDVYALGVLLYQMLTGELPFEDGELARPDRPAPRRPSLAAAEDRFVKPLSRGEWNDLNVLCLTAMRFEPERRYPSVEAMIRDVDAFLEERPLEARAENWSYRLRKFVIRRRRRLLYATCTVIALAGLVGYFTFRLRQARDEALAEAARTERIQQFTANLFRGNESSVGPAGDLRVRTLLDRGREEANHLYGDPDMQADMRETLGEIYRKLGDTKQAETLLTASLDRWRSQMKQNPGKYAENLLELGQLRTDEAKLDEAESLIREGLQVSRSLSPRQQDRARTLTTNAMVALGSVLEAKGQYPQAATMLESGLQMRPHSNAPDADTALNLRELANVHFYQGHYMAADTLNRQVLGIHRALYGERHPEVAEDLNNLGAVQLELGNLGRAEEQYRQALAITEAWYGPEHPKTAEDLTSLARAFVREKKYKDAEPVLERALKIQEQVHGHDHPAVASALNELGSIEVQQEDFGAAESDFTEALAIWRKIYGPEHQFIGVGLSNLGSVYMSEKKYPLAEQMYRDALKVFIETVQEDHLNTGIAHIKLGRSLLRQRRFSEAEHETLRGYQTLAKLVAPGNGFLKAAETDLVQIYTGLNRTTDADRFRIK